MSQQPTSLYGAFEGRYAIEREIGRGGMATVYLARDLKHDRPVALKVLRPELAASIAAERFLREIQLAARLQHPHILTLHDSGAADGMLYYVMPFIDGESLRDKLKRDGALPISETVRVFREIVDALSYAHAQGIVHRDIKPENVMVSGRHAVVMDFGVAKALSDAAGTSLTTVGMAVGTPAYMAPEQAAADPNVDHRADIYAAGAVAYEMLTGHPPVSGDSPQKVLAAQITTTPMPVNRYRKEVPAALTEVVMRCLAKPPQARWQTAEALLSALEPFGRQSDNIARRRPARVAVAAVVLIVGVGLAMALRHNAMVHWAREQAMPRIRELADSGHWETAAELALRAQAIIPHDSLLFGLLRNVATPVRIRTVPPGARVYRRPYTSSDTTWQYLGTTPLDSAWLPGGFLSHSYWFWYSRLKLEKPGYRSLEAVASPFSMRDTFLLDDGHTFPPGMVRVPGGREQMSLQGLEQLEPITVGSYFIDRYEVTNREFKRFVDSGGYRRAEFWSQPFVRDGRTLRWEDGIALLKDKTGRPGPALWEAGDYTAGQAEYPVTGVSWYEAAAYARFAGKELPTIWQWIRAAGTGATSFIVPASNLAGKGLAPVGSFAGMGPFATYDMAGNVREWCWNETGGWRYILGGGWNDPTYAFNDASAQPPFDRSQTNGFRLVKSVTPDSSAALEKRSVEPIFRNYAAERPVSDAIFAVYRRLYDYDRTPLNAVVEERDTTPASWVRERITFDAAYGNERVMAYLFLPKRGHAPYETVVFFPHSGAVHYRSYRDMESFDTWVFDFILKSGRAFMYPVYKSTFERGDDYQGEDQSETNFYRDHVVMWAKDLRRSVDYLQTRPEVDSTKLAYYGMSWGGQLGGLMPAIERRFRAVVLYVAGLQTEKTQPEVDPFNYLPHIKAPVLMLNGRYDPYFPVETSQRPMFHWLGTPQDHKRQVIYDGGHFVPRPQLITETLDWLDRYLGPVK